MQGQLNLKKKNDDLIFKVTLPFSMPNFDPQKTLNIVLLQLDHTDEPKLDYAFGDFDLIFKLVKPVLSLLSIKGINFDLRFKTGGHKDFGDLYLFFGTLWLFFKDHYTYYEHLGWRHQLVYIHVPRGWCVSKFLL